MIKLVVFDMAGTTVDEDNVVYKMVRAAINAATPAMIAENCMTHRQRVLFGCQDIV